ncbi:MAG: hypothetical protein HY319_28420 [Armatimonadetes bacterium]|nr:hypothetical protein [Armatimonadota bacterium]
MLRSVVAMILLAASIAVGVRAGQAGVDLRIESIVHNGTKLGPGDRLHVLVRGTPGGVAGYDIPGVAHGLGLAETRPGFYEGTFMMFPGLVRVSSPVLARLTRDGRTVEERSEEPVSYRGAADAEVAVYPDPSGGADSQGEIRFVFGRTIRADTVRLSVDGKDRTPGLRLESNYFAYRPAERPAAGQHRVRVEALDLQGEKLAGTWSFETPAVTLAPCAATAGSVATP